MKNLLFHFKNVKTGTHKAKVGAGSGAETFLMSEPELEPKKIVSAPQHCWEIKGKGCKRSFYLSVKV
jgi:hypothetical protein